MSEPRKGEVRKTQGGRIYYIQGPYRPAGISLAVTPLTAVVEVEGAWAGRKFSFATEDVEGWEVVSKPVNDQ